MKLRNLPAMVKNRRLCILCATCFLLFLLGVELFQFKAGSDSGSSPIVKNATASARKLLQSGDTTNRIGESCSKNDIAIYQGRLGSLPNGIPSYMVEILNMSPSGRSIANIHVTCGEFSSVRLINPTIFRRVVYDDCLVNDGKALGHGETISFQYANTFPYPLSVSSIACS